MENKLKINEIFIKSLSKQRFSRYLTLANNNEENAISLYTLNSRISESLYIPLQGLEVCLRNSVDSSLTDAYGDFWFDRPNLLRTGNQIEDIALVKGRILAQKNKEAEPILHGRVIAGQSFGFWTSMFNSEYEILWRESLHKIVVVEGQSATRKTFSGPLKSIREIRNRIAHHECILGYALKDHYKNILLLTNLLNPHKARWIEENSRFYQMYGEMKNE